MNRDLKPTERKCSLTQVVSQSAGLSMWVKVVITDQLQPHAGEVLSAGNPPVHLILLPFRWLQNTLVIIPKLYLYIYTLIPISVFPTTPAAAIVSILS